MPGLCVIGLQWGDEAKGKLVDWLTEGQRMVVRYQGGANAGHTVVVGDQVYKLHLMPSGILNADVLNLIASGVVLDPAVLLGEMDSLEKRGIKLEGRLKLSNRAHVVMPWHQVEDQIWNDLQQGDANIGTTLRGIGPCYRDKVGRSYAIRLGDLLSEHFPERVAEIASYKERSLAPLSQSIETRFDANQIAKQYAEYGQRLSAFIDDTNRIMLDAVDEDWPVLFEGAQGSLLDIDHGTFPFVTSSNSSGVGVTVGAGAPPRFIHKTIGVAKAYSTRVGGGPFPTEQDNETGEHIRQLGNEFGTTTGRPRRCGWFDAVAVRYTCRLGGVSVICLTMLDVLSELDEIQVCVAYELDGKTIDYFPASVEELRRVRPVYETLPGFKQDVTGARTVDDLPENALKYIDRIAQLCGRPIAYVSVGPDRAQTIVMDAAVGNSASTV